MSQLLRPDIPPWLPETIRNKREFYSLWHNRQLGNSLRTWNTLEEVPLSFSGHVMVRQAGAIGGGVVEEAPVVLLPALVASIIKRGIPLRDLRFNECAPDMNARLQGEVRIIDGNIYGRLWRRPDKDFGKLIRMRQALEKAEELSGPEVYFLLRQYLSPASHEDVIDLLTMYQGHVVELTAYSHDLGWARGRNTIIWEVRNN
jgi:hypothetical protein